MDEILANKPVHHLENTDNSIKTYILLLENKLKSCITMNNLNKEIERKLFVTQEELHTLKMRDKENCNNDEQLQEDIMKLKVNNTVLEIENTHLKQQINMLQTEVEKLTNAAIVKTTTTVCNRKEIHQTHKNIIAADKDSNINSILVKGFVEHQLNTFLQINIIYLGRLMNVKVVHKDIINVTKMERKYYERHNLKPNKIILIVQLRSPELKVEFLKNKEKLKANMNYAEIEISDYVSDEVYNLYQYAKILKNYGYAQIYWRNNCVFAKRTPSTYCEPVPIKTKADVDILMK